MERKKIASEVALAANQSLKEKRYWLKQLSGELVKSTFPYDFFVRSTHGPEQFSGRIDQRLFQLLSGLVNNSESRMHMVLVTALMILLGRYSGHTDIMVGTPIKKQKKGGEFINTVLVLRNSITPDKTFRELLLEVRETIRQATENQNFPLETLLNELGFAPPGNRDFPLFDVKVMLSNIHHRHYFQQITTNIEFVFDLHADGLAVTIEYNGSRYRKESVERIFSHFVNVLTEGMRNVDVAVKDIDIMSELERRQVLDTFNRHQLDIPGSRHVVRLFHKMVEAQPDSVALVYQDLSVSYKALWNRCAHRAADLQSHGVVSGGLVGVMADRCAAMIEALLAIIMAGGAYLPLSPKLPDQRIEYMVRDSEAVVVLAERHYEGRLKHMTTVLPLESSGGNTEEVLDLHTDGDPTQLAYCIYTSGSTGKPKGVLVEHGNVVNLVYSLKKQIYDNYPHHLNVCLVAPYEFDASVQQIFPSLLLGHRLCVVPEETRMDGELLRDYYRRFRIDISDGTPTHIRLLVEGVDGRSLDVPVRHFLVAGEEFPLKLARQFLGLCDLERTRVSNLYGPTETTVDSTGYDITRERLLGIESIPIGTPLANETVYIVGAMGNLQPAGVPGELCVGGAGVARGYLKRDQLTAEKFIDNPFAPGQRLYKTGDLARWLPDGTIEFIGRTDHQLKLRGFRIEPGEIEHYLEGHDAVKNAMVSDWRDKTGERHLVAYLTPDPSSAGTVCRLLRFKDEGILKGHKVVEMPNGLPVFHLSQNETDLMYEEIFEEQAYLQEGIALEEGACVLDVGANIGLFSMMLGRGLERVKLYAFEPVPAIYDVLKLNLDLYDIEAETFNVGLSHAEGDTEFAYYPNVPGLSGQFPDLEEDMAALAGFIKNSEAGSGGESLADDQLREVLKQRLTKKYVSCKVKTISSVLAEQNIETVHLLKIVAEKSEWNILRGIDEEDWPKIQQLVVEVHDSDGRLDKITSLLRSHGYEVVVRQDEALEGTVLHNVFARRHTNGGQPSGAGLAQHPAGGVWFNPTDLVEDLRDYAREGLPDYMVPTLFVPLERFPLKPNGKIDRQRLPEPVALGIGRQHTGPRNEADRQLIRIWAGVLGVGEDTIGIESDFFELGGHSLRATILVSRIHKEFDVKVPLVEVFRAPSVRELSDYIQKAAAAKFEAIQPVGEREHYRLSSAQKRLYFFQQMDPDSTAYNLPQVLWMSGPLDMDRLRGTFQRLVNRHEGLRTSFKVVDGEAAQIIHESLDMHVEFLELSLDEADDSVRRFVRPFDLTQAPLMRVRVVEVAADRYVLMVDMHHIVSDGVSNAILVKEFMALYDGKPLPPLRLQYRDYAEWQADFLDSEEMANQEAFWLARFRDAEPYLDLPFDYDGAGVQEFTGKDVTADIDEATAWKIEELARACGTTQFVVLLAVCNILASRYTRGQDITVGVPIAGRKHADLENIIGMFVNMLPIRNQCSPDLDFEGFVARVNESFVEAMDNQDYQFDVLVDRLNYKRQGGRNPLSDLVFALDNIEASPLQMERLRFEPYGYEHATSKRAIRLGAFVADHSIRMTLTYATSLFKQSTAQIMMDNYLDLVRQVTENPGSSLGDLKIRHSLIDVNGKRQDDGKDFDF
jgi:amino acid adenylation domain-containing protein/FkbM family methyltransferase